jgi:hypothetical protein
MGAWRALDPLAPHAIELIQAVTPSIIRHRQRMSRQPRPNLAFAETIGANHWKSMLGSLIGAQSLQKSFASSHGACCSIAGWITAPAGPLCQFW